MQSSFIRRATASLIAFAAATLSLAVPIAARADADADAGVGVARLSLINGSVAVQRGDSTSPVSAVINAPLLAADYLTTGARSRAEVQFDGNSMVRLGENVQMRLSHLDRGSRQLQLAEGTVDVRLLRNVDGRTDIDTPSVSVQPLAAGSYRVTVDASGQTAVTVRSGRASIKLPQGDQTLAPGNTLLASGAAANPTVQIVGAIAADDFDRFNEERDQREVRALANAYVDPGVQGVDDLDAYGRWVADGKYGNVWVPTYVATGWAPYRDGRWVWEDGYGWTWIGFEPWGWAPYHYGRWYHSSLYGWAWYPPAPAVVYVPWRPALVAFIGFGSGTGLSFGFGNIGWVPLGPFEAYHPWWGRGYNQTTIVNNINVTNNYYGNVTKVYGNARYNGVTYVPQRRFTEGRFDHPGAMTAAQLRTAHIVSGAVPIVPTQANLRFGDRPVPASLAARTVPLARSFAGTPAVVERMPFEQQRAALATHLTPASRSVPGQTNATAGAKAVSDPWSRFGQNRGATVPVIDGAKPAAVRPATATSHSTNAAASSKVHGGDAWSRFDTNAHATTDSKPSHTVGPSTTHTTVVPPRTPAAHTTTVHRSATVRAAHARATSEPHRAH